MRLTLAVTVCQTVSGGSLVLGFPETSMFVLTDAPVLIFSSLPSGASMLFCFILFTFVFVVLFLLFSISVFLLFKKCVQTN